MRAAGERVRPVPTVGTFGPNIRGECSSAARDAGSFGAPALGKMTPVALAAAMLPAATDGSMNALLDEAWDLQEAIEELEARREKVRAAILTLCGATKVDRWRHARGSVSLQRYASYKVARPSTVLDALVLRGWQDDVLQVKGRALYGLANDRGVVPEAFAGLPRVDHTVLTLRRKRTA
jgi:hypothetical protein